MGKAVPIPQPSATAGTQVAPVVRLDAHHPVSQTLLRSGAQEVSPLTISVNPSAAVNRESPRDFAILDGVGIRTRAILDADLAGRDEQLGLAVNKKPQKTWDLYEKSRDSRLGFLCLPDWRSFEPILKGSPGWARTTDTRINSPLLCRLSYRGMILCLLRLADESAAADSTDRYPG